MGEEVSRRQLQPAIIFFAQRFQAGAKVAKSSRSRQAPLAGVYALDRFAPLMVRRGIVRPGGGVFERAAAFQVRGDARRPKGVIADLRLDVGAVELTAVRLTEGAISK
jgi:hypothetical protein